MAALDAVVRTQLADGERTIPLAELHRLPGMYAAPNRRTTHRIVALDVPPPTIMRAPGEAQGMFALESAMDEMAIACGLDPIELRIRNEPDVHPESGRPFSSRNVVACLREGARRFGWEPRDPTPRVPARRGRLVGTGVASSTYPVFPLPGSAATIRVGPDGRYTVSIAAADIGTGTWTTLPQIAADALGVAVDDIDLQIGDSALPPASSAGFSSGIHCWGSAIVAAAEQLRARLESAPGGTVPDEGLEVTATMPDDPDVTRYARHAFGAQFAEVRVDEDTGEVRVPRLVGVFAVGRVINPKLARSQMIGGNDTGVVDRAVRAQSVVDPQTGHVVNHDFGQLPHRHPRRLSARSRRTSWTKRMSTPTRWDPRASARSPAWAPPRRSPTPSTTPPAGACATCRSRSTSGCEPLRASSAVTRPISW